MPKRYIDAGDERLKSSKKHESLQAGLSSKRDSESHISDEKQATHHNSSTSSDLERRVSLLRKRLKREPITTNDDLTRVVNDILKPTLPQSGQAPSPHLNDNPPTTFLSALPFSTLYSLTSNLSPPTLPLIKGTALLSRIFTHRGTIHGSVGDMTYKSYERLEFLGDAYIELAASRCLYHGYEFMTPQQLSSVRETLVCNDTLASIALRHGFDAETKVPVSHLAQGQDRTAIWKKMLGDILEAYVAGVVLDDPEHGYQRVERWLFEEWAAAGKLPDSDSEKVRPFDPVAKQLLAKKLGGKVIKIEYEECEERVIYRGGTTYTVGVYLTGWGFEKQILGTGKGKSVKEAGHAAASEALVNPLSAQMNAIKREFDAKVAAEREREKTESVTGGQEGSVVSQAAESV